MGFFWKRNTQTASYAYHALNNGAYEEEFDLDDADTFEGSWLSTRVSSKAPSTSSRAESHTSSFYNKAIYVDRSTQTSPEPALYVTQTRRPRVQTNVELRALEHKHEHRYRPGIVVIKNLDDGGEVVIEETYVDDQGGGRRPEGEGRGLSKGGLFARLSARRWEDRENGKGTVDEGRQGWKEVRGT